jgi:hypothetical protein
MAQGLFSQGTTSVARPSEPTPGTPTAADGINVTVPFTVSSFGPAATSYTVVSTPDSITTTTTSTTTVSYVDSALNPGTTYTFQVRGNNANGNGKLSSASTSYATTSVVSAIEYLVVAGGGSGASSQPNGTATGGAGAGGYRTGFQSVTLGTGYTVTVGAGGARATGQSQYGSKGSDSVFGSISSTGGGRGNILATPGTAGGSGSGASGQGNPNTGGAGNEGGYTPVEGFAGGASGSGSFLHSAGGGGSSAAAPNYAANNAGPGGTGTVSTISGSSVTYATGGRAGQQGGREDGTDNTGTGGSGSRWNEDNQGNGGSGVVIMRFKSGYNSLTTIGAGLTYTLTTTGGYKIYRFTAGTGTVTV